MSITTEQIHQDSMTIILNAGDARNLVQKSLEQLAEFQFENAESLLEEASEFILKAHHKQTFLLQSEAREEQIPYSILFTHAQDHLMTANSELLLARSLMKMFKILQTKINIK